MLLFEHQRLWTPTIGGLSHTHKRDLIGSVPGQWVSRSCTFVTCSCLPFQLDTHEGGSSTSAAHSHTERQQLLLRQYSADPTLRWECKQDKEGFRPTVLECQGDVTAHTVSKLCEKGQLFEAVDALSVLARTESRVSTFLLYTVLKRCVAERNLVMGRRLHDLTVKLGYESNAFLGNHILRMYACQGRLQEAMDVFTRVGKPDAFMWFSIISAHAKHGKAKLAIQLYNDMRSSGVKLDTYVFVAALQACASAGDLETGRQVHTDVLESGVAPNSFVGNSLVDMYAKCGKLEDARTVFDTLATRNVVTWNAMIGGYAKCGRLEDARRLFDSSTTRDVVTWTAMISGYAEHGLGQEALALYATMEHEGSILANGVTFACLLKACARVGALRQGKQLHSQIMERGLLESDIVVGNCLVEMYAKCGNLEDARAVFDTLPSKDVVTWNALIAGYAKCGMLEDARKLFDNSTTKDVVTWNSMIAGYDEHGLSQESLALYSRMEQEGHILATSVTFASLLKACASAGALQKGKQLHSQILERGLLFGDSILGTCLIEMYAKCGRLEDARSAFDTLPTRNVVTWTAMINGYGQSSEGHKAIACFQEMLQNGVEPDGTTFTCLLVTCSHEGLVNEGRQYFKAMLQDHGITPTIEHCTCMVDLLGRAGHLDEAEKMLLSFESNEVGLMSLLSACRSHGDIQRGTRCFESLVRLDPQNASPYVLMASTYSDAGRWADVDRIETLRRAAGASKKPAIAGIEVNKQVHTFVVGDKRDDISCKAHSMNVRLREEGGHVPLTELVLKPLSKKEKEDELCGHAEKLALAYGLLNTPDGTPLLVTKNLRMCRDCHSSTEIMSRIEKREIVVRDAHRVHRFAGGSCRCGGRP